jgi:hypothetical protein
VRACRPTQLVRLIDHELAVGHVGLGRGLGERQAVDGGGAGEQVVVPGMGVRWEPCAVPGGRDDDFESAGDVGDGAGEDLVGPSPRQDRPVTPGARSVRAARMAWSIRCAVGLGSPRWQEIAMRYKRAI